MMIRSDASAGLTLRTVGGAGRLVGSWPPAALIAACTSWAAPSMLRDSSNCSVMLVLAERAEEVICGDARDQRELALERRRDVRRHGLRARARAALALTCSVGKSTSGSAETGRLQVRDDADQRAPPPRAARSRPAGVMKGAEMFIGPSAGSSRRGCAASEADGDQAARLQGHLAVGDHGLARVEGLRRSLPSRPARASP